MRRSTRGEAAGKTRSGQASKRQRSDALVLKQQNPEGWRRGAGRLGSKLTMAVLLHVLGFLDLAGVARLLRMSATFRNAVVDGAYKAQMHAMLARHASIGIRVASWFSDEISRVGGAAAVTSGVVPRPWSSLVPAIADAQAQIRAWFPHHMPNIELESRYGDNVLRLYTHGYLRWEKYGSPAYWVNARFVILTPDATLGDFCRVVFAHKAYPHDHWYVRTADAEELAVRLGLPAAQRCAFVQLVRRIPREVVRWRIRLHADGQRTYICVAMRVPEECVEQYDVLTILSAKMVREQARVYVRYAAMWHQFLGASRLERPPQGSAECVLHNRDDVAASNEWNRHGLDGADQDDEIMPNGLWKRRRYGPKRDQLARA
jgi:hypothetical protein